MTALLQGAFRATPLVRRVSNTLSRRMSVRAASSTRVLKVAHILVNKDEAATLDELDGRLQGGAAFDDLARQHSKCQSAKKGGELGWLSPGTYFPEFEQVVFATAVGGTARITTARGHHLLKVLAERRQSVVVQMSCEELYELLHNPALSEDVQLVDVREDFEFDTARIPGFKLLPLSRFQEWSGRITTELDPAKETLVLCHHGVRSMQMAGFLVSQGFTDVKNITGGIDAYSRVDPSVPIY